MLWCFGKEKDIAEKPAVRRPSAKRKATAGGCGRRGKHYQRIFKRRQKTIRKGIFLYGLFLHGALQLKIFVGTAGQSQSDRTGGHPLQRVVSEGGTVGAGGNNPFFGADDLSGRQLMAPGAVGAARLDGGLEQLYGGSLLCQVRLKTIILHSARLFHCFFVPPGR